MKNILTLIICFVISTSIFGQENFQYSEPFKEPEGWTKLIQLKNGNTGMFEVTKRDGIHFTLFGTDRKIINSKKLKLPLVDDSMGATANVLGCYEINGNAVIFVRKSVEKVSSLLRIVVNAVSGELIEEVLVLQSPWFILEKDSESDYYTVIISSNSVNDINNAIKVYLFNKDHIMESNYNVKFPSNSYKIGKALGAFVKGNDYIIINAFASTQEPNIFGPQVAIDGQFYVGKTVKDKTDIELKEINFKCSYKYTPNCDFTQNKINNQLMMAIYNYSLSVDGNLEHNIVFQSINPDDMNLSPIYTSDTKKLKEIYNARGNDGEFKGNIQATEIDNSGKFYTLYHLPASNQGNYKPANNQHSGTNIPMTHLSDIGLNILNSKGIVENAFLINYSIIRSGEMSDAFFYNLHKKGKKPMFTFQGAGLSADWLFNLDFIHSETSVYLFLNNTVENFELSENAKPRPIKAISSTDAIKYTIKNGLITKEYLFGKPENEKTGKFCNFTSASYNPSSKTYAVVVNDKKLKKNFVVWFKLN